MQRAIGQKFSQKPTSIIGMKGAHQVRHVIGALKVMQSAISPSDFNKGQPEGMNEIYGNSSNSSDIVWQPIGLKSYGGSGGKSKLEKKSRR
jgi:hypothetical protein